MFLDSKEIEVDGLTVLEQKLVQPRGDKYSVQFQFPLEKLKKENPSLVMWLSLPTIHIIKIIIKNIYI